MTQIRVLIGVVALLLATVACSSTDDPPEKTPSGDDMTTTTDDLVCGLVSPELVRRVLGDAPIDTRGAGLEGTTDGAPAQCRILHGERTQTVMQLSIGAVDPAEWGPRLQQEADSSTYGDCTKRYDGDPGTGYGCTYDSGTFVAGASVHVLTGDHLIRATVYNWPDATPEERLALAEDVARDLESNYTAATGATSPSP